MIEGVNVFVSEGSGLRQLHGQEVILVPAIAVGVREIGISGAIIRCCGSGLICAFELSEVGGDGRGLASMVGWCHVRIFRMIIMVPRLHSSGLVDSHMG